MKKSFHQELQDAIDALARAEKLAEEAKAIDVSVNVSELVYMVSRLKIASSNLACLKEVK